MPLQERPGGSLPTIRNQNLDTQLPEAVPFASRRQNIADKFGYSI